jgi:hypothetical protein
MSNRLNEVTIGNKDWLYDLLWSSSSYVDSSEKSAGCAISIPLTFLFHHGEPQKCMYTDSSTGEVVRYDFRKAIFERDNSGTLGSVNAANPLLTSMRTTLVDYMNNNGYMDDQKDMHQPLTLTVTYMDGDREDLDLSRFDILIRNEAWRSQVLLMQSYIPTLSIHTGRYFIDDNAGGISSLVDSNHSAAADKLTRAISKHIETVYQLSKPPLVNENFNQKKVKINNMSARFALDFRNRVIFLHSETINIAIGENGRNVEQLIKKEKVGRENNAALGIYHELRKLLLIAMKKGLSISDAYDHFDESRSGFIDTSMLMEGLGRLGIGVTFSVGEQLLQLIGGIGTNFITLNDFNNYLAGSQSLLENGRSNRE